MATQRQPERSIQSAEIARGSAGQRVGWIDDSGGCIENDPTFTIALWTGSIAHDAQRVRLTTETDSYQGIASTYQRVDGVINSDLMRAHFASTGAVDAWQARGYEKPRNGTAERNDLRLASEMGEANVNQGSWYVGTYEILGGIMQAITCRASTREQASHAYRAFYIKVNQQIARSLRVRIADQQKGPQLLHKSLLIDPNLRNSMTVELSAALSYAAYTKEHAHCNAELHELLMHPPDALDDRLLGQVFRANRRRTVDRDDSIQALSRRMIQPIMVTASYSIGSGPAWLRPYLAIDRYEREASHIEAGNNRPAVEVLEAEQTELSCTQAQLIEPHIDVLRALAGRRSIVVA
jgi:hypothetical protein